LTKWVWSSKMNWPAWLAPGGLPASAGVTSKTRPKTSSSATRAVVPQLVRGKFRRLYPNFSATPSANSFSRASNRRCCGVCGKGLNSPLEIIRVGTGERSAARSAGFVCANSRSRTPSSSSPHGFSARQACERQDRLLEMFVADRKSDLRSRGAGSRLNDITRA